MQAAADRSDIGLSSMQCDLRKIWGAQWGWGRAPRATHLLAIRAVGLLRDNAHVHGNNSPAPERTDADATNILDCVLGRCRRDREASISINRRIAGSRPFVQRLLLAPRCDCERK